ncbi:MAG: hypothetical protein K8R77_16760 [Anaerolineaceae bacterium]|nr:hypothetical protein [Anaerolineaceae bacterium]
MTKTEPAHTDTDHQVRQALWLWGVFIVFIVILNGTIPFALGADLRVWTHSTAKIVLMSLVVYAGLFPVVPLILVKGWKTVRQPAFLLPLLVAVIAITLWYVVRGIAGIALVVLAYLHWHFDLSGLGIRSRGWRGDVLAILFLGLLNSMPVFLQPGPYSFSLGKALLSGVSRLFTNPASSVENLFYFGFLTKRLSHKTGKWLTPFLIAAMYTAHEMSNPEYWYGGMPFVLIFLAVAISVAIYLWRQSAVVIWLSSGLGSFATQLLQ